jgi:hypothetical protein
MFSPLTPSFGGLAGWTTTIVGTNMGANDIYAMSFSGVNATAWTWVSATKIIAVTGSSPVASTGSVIAESTSFGRMSTCCVIYLPVRGLFVSPCVQY